MKNNVHDKEFACPECINKTLIPVEYDEVLGIGYNDLLICEECGTELRAYPNYDLTVGFFKTEEEK